jgi:NADH dehydrogenase
MRGSPTVAITGANGLIGRHLCAAFRREGYRVRALVRCPCRHTADIEKFTCDLPQSIDPKALDGADILVHAAYMTRFSNVREARAVNEVGSARLVTLARKAGVRQIVFLSSFSARADARSCYGRSKFAVEQLLDSQRDTALRAGLVLASDGGLFQRIVAFLKRARIVPLVGGGRQIVQTIHIDDLCQACLNVTRVPVTGLVNVAEPNGLPFRDLLRLVAERLGRPCWQLPVPAAPVMAVLRITEMLRLPLGVSSENLLGLQLLRPVAVGADLTRLGLALRAARQSIADLIPLNRDTPMPLRKAG